MNISVETVLPDPDYNEYGGKVMYLIYKYPGLKNAYQFRENL